MIQVKIFKQNHSIRDMDAQTQCNNFLADMGIYDVISVTPGWHMEGDDMVSTVTLVYRIEA